MSGGGDAFRSALAQFLGAENVCFTPEAVEPYTRTTGPHARVIRGVARPASTEEVAGVVRLAGEHGVPLYPVSTGRNWGYGDTLPPTDHQLILDLGRMNRILEIDETLAYVIIEPAVTQGMLYEYIKARGLKLWMDSTGAGPDAGIVGNILERGFGHTPYGDRFQSVSGMEVVLGTGDVVRTGFARYPDSALGPLYPYGTGPVLDGLFSQSSFGIVTRMGVWLMPEPECFAAAVVMAPEPATIGPLIDRLRPLRLDGTLKSVVHIANDLRLMSGQVRYPYDRMRGDTPLSEDVRAALRRELKVSAWGLSAGFYGSRGEVRAQIRTFKRSLRGLDVRCMILDIKKLGYADRAMSILGAVGIGKGLAARIEDGKAALGLLKGVPSRHFLKGAYWRSRTNPGSTNERLDPAAEGAGLMWLAPVLPATGEHTARLLALVEPIYRTHGFECLLTFSLVNGRSLAAVMTIAFDAEDRLQAAAARTCYGALMDALIKAGYPPYRGHSGEMARLVDADDPYWQTVGRLKAALDPAGIIAPGRYTPLDLPA